MYNKKRKTNRYNYYSFYHLEETMKSRHRWLRVIAFTALEEQCQSQRSYSAANMNFKLASSLQLFNRYDSSLQHTMYLHERNHSMWKSQFDICYHLFPFRSFASANLRLRVFTSLEFGINSPHLFAVFTRVIQKSILIIYFEHCIMNIASHV